LDTHYTYDLSVIIVNYNVEYFLDQCLDAVKKGIKDTSVEVIIIDNASIDGSIELLKNKHPEFKHIINKENVGFSKANNQGIDIAQGKYVLLLNPDTVVKETTFGKVIAFMDSHEDAGGLGVRMVDGKGEFLPESKRGLPTPMVAFYKIFGLSQLFPKSKRFGQYHMGHLDEHETNEIDVLSGAFMLMRKSVLDKVGTLDEDFFMYGEDIDLSFRIQKGGFKNYYFPETSIIHYKGESTKKSSVNYVFVFYRAMIIFANKHFTGNNAWLFSFLINLAIYFRALLAISVRIIKQLFLPLIDSIYIVGGLFALTNYWKLSNIEFPEELIKYSIPAYGLAWVITMFFNGGYDYPIKLFKYIKGTIFGTLLILVAYAILPKSFQFSRLFIFLGAGWVVSYYFISRIFLHFGFGGIFKLTRKKKRSYSIIGSKPEATRVSELLSQTQENQGDIDSYLSIDAFEKAKRSTDEIIFCSGDSDYTDIIDFMSVHRHKHYDYKIAPANVNHLIGSNSIDTAGDLYILSLNVLVNSENKRKKRLFDFLAASCLLISMPFSVFLFDNKTQFAKNTLQILIGRMSFIGFSNEVSMKDVRLPRIKPGVLTPDNVIDGADEGIKEKLNLLYARDYSMRKDFSIFWKSWHKLDR